MLKRLLKYDLTSIFKFLLIFYSLALFFGLSTRFFLSFDNNNNLKITTSDSGYILLLRREEG
jgi:hypothetical protein